MGDVILDTRSLANKGFFVERIPNPEVPERNVEEVSIPGISGVNYNDNGSWKEVRRQYQVAAIYGRNNILDYKDAYRKLMQWLGYSFRSDGSLNLPSSVYYELGDTYNGLIADGNNYKIENIQRARLDGQVDLVDINKQACTATITFAVDPVKYYNQTIRFSANEVKSGYNTARLINPYYEENTEPFAVNLGVYSNSGDARKIEIHVVTPTNPNPRLYTAIIINSGYVIAVDSVRGVVYNKARRGSMIGVSSGPNKFLLFGSEPWIELHFYYYKSINNTWVKITDGTALGSSGYLEVMNKCSKI